MWEKFRKTAEQEMRDYIIGEDLTGISVAPGETPKEGGKIARDNQGSFWYISPEFMAENYSKVDNFSREEQFISESIKAARTIQTMLWGESNGSWGLEEWRRMFIKRFVKIEMIDPANPHAIVELKKRLLQNAALSVALINILHHGRPMDITNDDIPSNLPQYSGV